MSKKRSATGAAAQSAASRFGDDLASVLALKVAGFAGPPPSTQLEFVRWDKDAGTDNGATAFATRTFVASKAGGILTVRDEVQGISQSIACTRQSAELVGDMFRYLALEPRAYMTCLKWTYLGMSTGTLTGVGPCWTDAAAAMVASWVRAAGDVA